MKKYFSTILFLIFVELFYISCDKKIEKKDNYPKDTRVSNTKGKPIDSLVFYFPPTIKRDTEVVKTKLDSFKMKWYSCYLFAFKEPILYNFYQGCDIYRFLWIRSFHRPIVFILKKEGDNISLVSKILDRQPQFIDMFYETVDFYDSTSKKRIPKVDSFVKADRKAEIIFNQSKKLSLTEWSQFDELLIKCGFWKMSPVIESSGLDGSEWIIEAHLQDRYWFVNRWSPEDSFRNCGLYLINLSKIKAEIY